MPAPPENKLNYSYQELRTILQESRQASRSAFNNSFNWVNQGLKNAYEVSSVFLVPVLDTAVETFNFGRAVQNMHRYISNDRLSASTKSINALAIAAHYGSALLLGATQIGLYVALAPIAPILYGVTMVGKNIASLFLQNEEDPKIIVEVGEGLEALWNAYRNDMVDKLVEDKVSQFRVERDHQLQQLIENGEMNPSLIAEFEQRTNSQESLLIQNFIKEHKKEFNQDFKKFQNLKAGVLPKFLKQAEQIKLLKKYKAYPKIIGPILNNRNKLQYDKVSKFRKVSNIVIGISLISIGVAALLTPVGPALMMATAGAIVAAKAATTWNAAYGASRHRSKKNINKRVKEHTDLEEKYGFLSRLKDRFSKSKEPVVEESIVDANLSKDLSVDSETQLENAQEELIELSLQANKHESTEQGIHNSPVLHSYQRKLDQVQEVTSSEPKQEQTQQQVSSIRVKR